jgi:hypothetical protein
MIVFIKSGLMKEAEEGVQEFRSSGVQEKEGRRKKEEGRRKKEEGRRNFSHTQCPITNYQLPITNYLNLFSSHPTGNNTSN